MVRYASPALTSFFALRRLDGEAVRGQRTAILAVQFDFEHIAADLRIDARAGVANRQRPLDAEDDLLAGKVERLDGDREGVLALGKHVAVAFHRHLDGVRARVADGPRDLRAVFVGDGERVVVRGDGWLRSILHARKDHFFPDVQRKIRRPGVFRRFHACGEGWPPVRADPDVRSCVPFGAEGTVRGLLAEVEAVFRALGKAGDEAVAVFIDDRRLRRQLVPAQGHAEIVDRQHVLIQHLYGIPGHRVGARVAVGGVRLRVGGDDHFRALPHYIASVLSPVAEAIGENDVLLTGSRG